MVLEIYTTTPPSLPQKNLINCIHPTLHEAQTELPTNLKKNIHILKTTKDM